MNLKVRAKKLKTDIPAIFIAMRNKETPMVAKIIAGITILYALSPVDLIPDFIPVLGYLDDVIILPALITITIRLLPEEVFETCKKQSSELWAGSKPQRWYYALPIILIWILIIFIIVKIIWF